MGSAHLMAYQPRLDYIPDNLDSHICKPQPDKHFRIANQQVHQSPRYQHGSGPKHRENVHVTAIRA